MQHDLLRNHSFIRILRVFFFFFLGGGGGGGGLVVFCCFFFGGGGNYFLSFFRWKVGERETDNRQREVR